MRVWRSLYVIGILLLSPGCALIDNAVDLVFFESKECVDEHLERVRNRRWAERAWEQVRGASTCPAGEDYAEGFKDGFADYLFEGGSGEPPLLPPHRYRGLKYQTPQGYQAVQDWFAGYRHGVRVAREGGYRQWVTGSTSLRRPDLAPQSLTVPEPAPPPAKLPDEAPPSQTTSFGAAANAPVAARAPPATPTSSYGPP